jgi:hypothetical protein
MQYTNGCSHPPITVRREWTHRLGEHLKIINTAKGNFFMTHYCKFSNSSWKTRPKSIHIRASNKIKKYLVIFVVGSARNTLESEESTFITFKKKKKKESPGLAEVKYPDSSAALGTVVGSLPVYTEKCVPRL